MGIILKSEILELAEGSAKILGTNFTKDNFESCSYDLRVGSVFKGKEIFNELFLNPSENSGTVNPNIIDVKPSEIVTILTLEEVKLPTNICASVYAINKMSSKGFLILNPGHIDPGYQGPISICAINLSRETISLQLGITPIFTIIFDKLSGNAEPYNKNRLFKTRTERDEAFSIDKARKLSTSFFDLIKLHEYKEYLEKVLIEIVIKRFLKIIGVLALIIGFVVSIIKLSESIASWNKDSVKKENILLNNKADSLQKSNDSLTKLILNRNEKVDSTK